MQWALGASRGPELVAAIVFVAGAFFRRHCVVNLAEVVKIGLFLRAQQRLRGLVVGGATCDAKTKQSERDSREAYIRQTSVSRNSHLEGGEIEVPYPK